MPFEFALINVQRAKARRCIVPHGGGLPYGLVRWSWQFQ